MRALWTCPRCGRRFVTRNIWHSCARHTLEEHFRGRDPEVGRIFDRLAAAVRRCGPVTIEAQQSGIVFAARMRFAGAVTRKRWLEARLLLPRRVRHPLLVRVVPYPSAIEHRFRLELAEQVDESLRKLLREAYDVGRQTSARPSAADLTYWERSPRKPRARPRSSAPLPTCPRCGRALAARNAMHSCVRYSLEPLLERATPKAVAIYRALAKAAGKCIVAPTKRRIDFRARTIFAECELGRDVLRVWLFLPRRVADPRIRQALSVAPHRHLVRLDLRATREIDAKLRGWLRDARALAS